MRLLAPLLLISNIAFGLPEYQEKAIQNLRDYLSNIEYDTFDAHMCFCCLTEQEDDPILKLRRPKVVDRKVFGILWVQMCRALNLAPDHQQDVLDGISEFSCPCCLPPSGIFRSFVRLCCFCGIPNGCCCQDCHYNAPTRRMCGFYVIDRDLAITAINTLEMQLRNREAGYEEMSKRNRAPKIPPGVRPRDEDKVCVMGEGV